MEGRQLDFNAPLLSMRRFAAAPPPATPPSSSYAAAAANSRAEVGGWGVAGERPRPPFLPFYKPELKSGPVRNPGVVPFVWEQSPGQPKDGDGSSAGDSPSGPSGLPVVAPKLPPGRIPRRLPDEKEEPISTDGSNSASYGALRRRSSPISSSTSSSAADRTLSKPLESSRKAPAGNVGRKPTVEPAAEAPISKELHSVGEEEDEEEDAFSDALDTLSRTESFFMNCSISGMSAGMEAPKQSGRFSTDPQVRDFMMGRFLPASQAVATGPPQCAPRKKVAAVAASVPGREPPRRVLRNGGELPRPAVSLPAQQRPNLASTYPRITDQLDVGNVEDREDDDSDDDYDDAGRLPMKGCGLLPRLCLKTSFGLLNPVPAMKARGRMPLPAACRPSPHLRTSHHGSVGDAEDEHTWEEVSKYKLRGERQPLGEEGSKFTSESNRLSYWSDSQTPDGSSPYRRSTTGGVSPYRNDMLPCPFHEGKGFLGVPKCEDRTSEDYAAFESCAKDDGEYWEITPHLNSKQATGSPSPVIEKTVYVDSVQVLANSDSKSCSLDTKDVTNCTDTNSKTGGESQRIETNPVLEIGEDNALHNKVFGVIDAEELCTADQLGPVEQMDNTMNSRQNHGVDGPQPLKADDQGKNDNRSLEPLLPLPLPKSPSESWLWRTLPSISSKNPTPQSFLGLPFRPKKQVTQASSTDPKWEEMVKASTLRKGQVRFADVLIKPANVN